MSFALAAWNDNNDLSYLEVDKNGYLVMHEFNLLAVGLKDADDVPFPIFLLKEYPDMRREHLKRIIKIVHTHLN